MKAKALKVLALAWAKRHAIVTTVTAVYVALHRAGVL